MLDISPPLLPSPYEAPATRELVVSKINLPCIGHVLRKNHKTSGVML